MSNKLIDFITMILDNPAIEVKYSPTKGDYLYYPKNKKSYNFPKDVTLEDVKKAFEYTSKLECKFKFVQDIMNWKAKKDFILYQLRAMFSDADRVVKFTNQTKKVETDLGYYNVSFLVDLLGYEYYHQPSEEILDPKKVREFIDKLQREITEKVNNAIDKSQIKTTIEKNTNNLQLS